MYEIDARLAAAVNGLAGHASIDSMMIWISALGVPFLVLAVAAQWWRRGDGTHRRHVLVATGLSFLLGIFFNQMILLSIQRPRPYVSGLTHLLIERSADYSFSSDHVTASFAIAAAFLLHGMRRTGLCFLVAAWSGVTPRRSVWAGTARCCLQVRKAIYFSSLTEVDEKALRFA